jgi:hypothetical protein
MIAFTLALALALTTADRRTLGQGPTGTPSPAPTSPLLAITPTAAATVPPAVQAGEPPPLTIALPEGWLSAYQVVPVRVSLEAYPMSVAIYRGPLGAGEAAGTGTIVVLWGFPSIAPLPTFAPGVLTPAATATLQSGAPQGMDNFTAQMLWTDGLRFLQGTILDVTCNVGTAGQQTITIGAQQAVGTYFNVNGCQSEPDTAGWFAGLRHEGQSFLFYAFIEPIEAYNSARADLRAIVDTVAFTAAPTSTPTP